MACEIGSFEFRYAKEHIKPLNERIPTTSPWLHALQKKYLLMLENEVLKQQEN